MIALFQALLLRPLLTAMIALRALRRNKLRSILTALGIIIGVASVVAMVSKLKDYVPGYQLIVPPTLEGGKVVTTIKVLGAGDYLPQYAGNLDIINCAAIAMAERIAQSGAHLDSST